MSFDLSGVSQNEVPLLFLLFLFFMREKLRTRTLSLHPDLGRFFVFLPVACLLPYMSFDLSGVPQNKVSFGNKMQFGAAKSICFIMFSRFLIVVFF